MVVDHHGGPGHTNLANSVVLTIIDDNARVTRMPSNLGMDEGGEPGNGRLVITHDLGAVSAECLGMTADEWSPNPVYDGRSAWP